MDNGQELQQVFLHNMPRAMFIFLPLLAGLMMLMYWRPRHYYVEHLLLFVHNHAFVFLVAGMALLLGRLVPRVPGLNFAIFLYFAWYMYRSMRVVYRQGRVLTVSKLLLLASFYLLFASLLVAITSVYSASHAVKEFRMRTLILTALLAAASLVLAQERTAAPAGAEVYIISPKDGAKVHSPVRVQFGLKGMGIAPAGVKFDNTGHHHLLVDTDAPADLSTPLPATDKIVHFGKGQTETTLTLTPGKHTLQLLLGDQNHIPARPAGDLEEDHHHGREVVRSVRAAASTR